MKKPDVSVVSAATVRHTGVHFWAGKGCHHESYDFNSAPPQGVLLSHQTLV